MKKLFLLVVACGFLFTACNESTGLLDEGNGYSDTVEKMEEFYRQEPTEEEIIDLYTSNDYVNNVPLGDETLGFYKFEPNSDNYIEVSSSVLVDDMYHGFFYDEFFDKSKVHIVVMYDRINDVSEITILTAVAVEDSLIENPIESNLYHYSAADPACSYSYNVEAEEYEIIESGIEQCTELDDTNIIDEAIINFFERLEKIYK